MQVKVAQGWQVIGTVGAEAENSHVPVMKCSKFQMTKPTLLLMGKYFLCVSMDHVCVFYLLSLS